MIIEGEERHRKGGEMRHLVLERGRQAAMALLAAVLVTACGAPRTAGPTGSVLRATSTPSMVGETTEARAATPTPRATAVTPDAPTRTPSRPPVPTPTSAPTMTPTERGIELDATAEGTTRLVEEATPFAPAVTTRVPQPGTEAPPSADTSVQIRRLEDPSPGPPFVVEVTTVRVSDGDYQVLGWVRSVGDETYEGIGVHGTFYTHGPSGRESGDESLYPHGPVEAQCPCLFLEPGATCPFSLEIYARNYVGYGLHPVGQPLALFKWREPAALTLADSRLSTQDIGDVRIQGMVVNENDFPVELATVAAALVDDSGRVVSVGSVLILETIAPGARVPFDLQMDYRPYARYELTVQGSRY
jgi:hypothetical protein